MGETVLNLAILVSGLFLLLVVAAKPKTISLLVFTLFGAWLGTEMGGFFGTVAGLVAGGLVGALLSIGMLALQHGFQGAERWLVRDTLEHEKPSPEERVRLAARLQDLESDFDGPYIYAWLSTAVVWAAALGAVWFLFGKRLGVR